MKIFKLVFATSLIFGCNKSNPVVGSESVCSGVVRQAVCTDAALSAIRGHFKLTCNPKVIEQSCNTDDIQTLTTRLKCMDDNNYCGLTQEFRSSISENKSRVSVDKYAEASLVLEKCAIKEVRKECEVNFLEDVYNPFDLPNNKKSLSYGLIRTGPVESEQHSGGTMGALICGNFAADNFARCANDMLALNNGHYSLVCDAQTIDKSCSVKEQEAVLGALACVKSQKFCEKAEAYLDLAVHDVIAAQPLYNDTFSIIEKCSTINIGKFCEMSFKQDIFNPLDLPNND